MSISPSLWAATERIKVAEQQKYGDVGSSRFDPVSKRRRNIRAMEDPSNDITDQTLPADSSRARMLRAVQETLESNNDAAIAQGAQDLANVVMSAPTNMWHLRYCQVVTTIISAAKAIDGQDAGTRLAKLVAALAARNDLTNSTEEDLTYDIGDYWVRPVVIPPGMALTGEGDAKIWSGMPSFHVWIKEELDSVSTIDTTTRTAVANFTVGFPGRDSGFPIDEQWPAHSWENLTCFCRQLSLLHIQGLSPISSFWLEHGIQLLNFIHEKYVSNDSRRPGLWTEAAIYMDLFGEEIYQLCSNQVKSGVEGPGGSEHDQDGLISAIADGFSSELWNMWLHAFHTFGASTSDLFKRRTMANAIVRMRNIEFVQRG